MLCSSPYIKHLVVLILRNKLHPELIQIICNMYHQLISFTNFINIKTLESTKCTFKTEPMDIENISIRLKKPYFKITFGKDRSSKHHKYMSNSDISCLMDFDTKHGNYTKIIDKSGTSLIEGVPLDQYIEIFRKYKQIEIFF